MSGMKMGTGWKTLKEKQRKVWEIRQTAGATNWAGNPIASVKPCTYSEVQVRG